MKASMARAASACCAVAAMAPENVVMIWMAAGNDDFALAGTRALDETLTKNGITHSFKITTGRHEWRLWRPHLYEFAQLLFR